MKLDFPDLLPGEEPISSIAQYLEMRNRYDQLHLQADNLRVRIKREENQGIKDEELDVLLERLTSLEEEEDELMYEMARRLPSVMISRCPYCQISVWMGVGIFSLRDEFWYHTYSNGKEEVSEDSLCPHLFCVDGALNLNGHQPNEAVVPATIVTNDRITMAAEVLFVKPRLLKLPGMVAVIHSFPIAGKYTAYPVVYFAEQQPNHTEFGIGWARIEHVDSAGIRGPGGGSVVITGRRSDKQDYELEKWVERDKLFWLGPEQEDCPLVHNPVSAFPYSNLPGRRHPYYIKEGQVYDLPDPVESEPEIRGEY